MANSSTQFGGFLTKLGIAQQANTAALGIPWNITHMLIGDAGGEPSMTPDPTPGPTQAGLVRQVHRAPLNAMYQSPTDPAVLVAELVLPPEIGGWWIRELALEDANGNFIAVAKPPPSYKPLLVQGSGRTQTIRMHVLFGNTANVLLKIDPSIVLATREYVDTAILSVVNKQDFKPSVLVASTAPLVLSGLQTVDGVALPAGARVLVPAQAQAKDNGIYIAATSAWSRAADADASAEVTPGLFVHVEQGTVNGDSLWQLVTDAPITLGTTALVFEMVAGRTGVTAGSYTKITVDKYGRAVGGTNPSTLAEMGIVDAYTTVEVNTKIAQAPLLRGSQSWTSAGVYQFIVPAGVTKGYVKVTGGGGSGRNSQIFGPGGGGGGVAEGPVDLVPGSTITITVGAGGSGISYSVSGGPGTPGGTSSFGSLMSATGGGGGDSSGGGGKSGVGTGGELNYGLGDGHSGVRNTSTVWGCPGNGGGAGGAGAVVDGSGIGQSPLRPGQAPGAGGGGRMDNGGLSGAGKDGAVSIRY